MYYKTLYELFRDEIDARLTGDDSMTATGFKDSEIWNQLYGFQRDGAQSAIAKLLTHNGCILADSVGLGKTYTALAVIKYFEQRNERVLVLCPRKLYENWSLYQSSNGHTQNPFERDRFPTPCWRTPTWRVNPGVPAALTWRTSTGATTAWW